MAKWPNILQRILKETKNKEATMSNNYDVIKTESNKMRPNY